MKSLGSPVVAALAIALVAAPASLWSQTALDADGPSDAKAIKSFHEAENWQRKHDELIAIDTYRTANKFDGGRCIACLRAAYNLALEVGALHQAVDVAREWVTAAQSDSGRASAHLRLGVALQRQGRAEKKSKLLSQSCDELKAAIAMDPALTAAHFSYGVSLANLNQDDAARAEFAAFVAQDHASPDLDVRARRYIERVDLARAVMAPPFSITTLDRQSVSLDSLTGKVVLIDFWATWCGPCREALPRVQKIAQKFQGQPLVILSVSLDQNESKWREFVAAHGMTWPQYRDGSFDGPLATLFAVRAIPATFTIDADGAIEDQHVGDASIEGKLKKLVARANELAQAKSAQPHS